MLEPSLRWCYHVHLMGELAKDCSEWQSKGPMGATWHSDHTLVVWVYLGVRAAAVQRRKAKLQPLE